MRTEKSLGLGIKKIKSVLMYSFLSLYTVISLYPIYFAIISSLKSDTEIFINPFALPKVFRFENYKRAWELANVGIFFKNSVLITVCVTIALIIVGTMASYILARFSFKLKSVVYLYFVMGMMIPVQSTIIPIAFNIGTFRLKDSIPALILVMTAFSISMTIFILTGFMKGIPKELEESAIIDGCNVFKVYWKIILPMSVPAIATASIFNFLAAWNNLLFPLIFISKKELMPISYGLLSFFGERQSDYGGVMAAIVITILPPMVAYVLLQEKVQKGLTAGAVKG